MSAGRRNQVRVGQYWQLWEFASPDTGAVVIEPTLLAHLDVLRARWGAPLRLSSAYRTPAHNTAVGGLPHSRHLTGAAVDVPIVEVDPVITGRDSTAAVLARGWIPRGELARFLALARALWPRGEDVVYEGDHVHLEVSG